MKLSRINELHRTVSYYILTVILMEIQYICFLHQIEATGNSIPGEIARTIGEVLLVTCPYWFAGTKWRKVLFIIPLIFTVFVLSNTLLYRSWGDIMGISYISFTGNINTNLVLSAVSLWQPVDWWLLILGLSPVGFYFLFRPLSYKFNKKTSWWLVGITFLIFILGNTIRVRGAYIDMKNENTSEEQVTLKSAITGYTATNLLNSTSLGHGAAVYIRALFAGIPEVISSGKIDLSDKDKKQINNYLESLAGEGSIDFEHNRGKNLILIIVESLDSYVVDLKIGEVEVTPNLNRMIREDGAVYCKRVISQVAEGRSIDGQMTLTTGIMPLPTGITWLKFPNYFSEIPSLPKIFDKKNTACVFGLDGKYWQESDFESIIGHGTIATVADYPELHDKYGSDGAMFNYGLQIAEKMNRPFMLTLVTCAMHTPYQEDKAELVPEFKSDNEMVDNYHQVTHYFDRCLGEFISDLKKAGLYDNSVIVVVSDHSRERRFGKDAEPMTFYGAFNTGHTQNIERMVGQVNLFPTTLQIMGRKDQNGYQGLAPSIFDDSVDWAIDCRGNIFGNAPDDLVNPYEISEKLLRGNYIPSTSKRTK